MKNVFTASRFFLGVAASLVLVSGAFGQASAPASSSPGSKQKARQLDLSRKLWTGDFDKMLERRVIRALVPYSRSLYFNDKGRERGLAAENVRDFEHWINKKYAKKLGKRPLTIYIIPTTRDKLLPEVVQGMGTSPSET